MSSEKILTVFTELSIWSSFFANSFRSSINSKWLIFLPPFSNSWDIFVCLNTNVNGIITNTNRSGGRLSPWNIPRLILTFPSLWLLAVSSTFHCFIDALTKDITLTATPNTFAHFCIQLCGTMRYRRLCDSLSMQLPMMLNASYNLPLTFCQLLVDLLCLGFLSCIPFVPMVMTLFFRGVCTILQLRCLLVTSRSEVVKWLV